MVSAIKVRCDSDNHLSPDLKELSLDTHALLIRQPFGTVFSDEMYNILEFDGAIFRWLLFAAFEFSWYFSSSLKQRYYLSWRHCLTLSEFSFCFVTVLQLLRKTWHEKNLRVFRAKYCDILMGWSARVIGGPELCIFPVMRNDQQSIFNPAMTSRSRLIPRFNSVWSTWPLPQIKA